MSRKLVLFLVICTLAKPFAEALSSTLPPQNAADKLLQSCLENMNIDIHSSVKILTTDISVAERGVFALEDLEEDETIAIIPMESLLSPQNGAQQFPHVAAFMKDQALFESDEVPWQAELTEYSLAAVEQQDEKWSTWIEQWQRDGDPVFQLFQSGQASRANPEAIESTAQALHKLLPEVPFYKILAALTLRIEEWESYQPFLTKPQATETATMYSLWSSRHIGITDDVVAVVPFHDQINHAFDPNLDLAISECGEFLEIFTLRDIPAGKELLQCYGDLGQVYSKDAAAWMLIHWGIPVKEIDWNVIAE